jgi:hypothetical protein
LNSPELRHGDLVVPIGAGAALLRAAPGSAGVGGKPSLLRDGFGLLSRLDPFAFVGSIVGLFPRGRNVRHKGWVTDIRRRQRIRAV